MMAEACEIEEIEVFRQANDEFFFGFNAVRTPTGLYFMRLPNAPVAPQSPFNRLHRAANLENV